MPMICSSVNRPFFISESPFVASFYRADLKILNFIWSKLPRAGHPCQRTIDFPDYSVDRTRRLLGVAIPDILQLPVLLWLGKMFVLYVVGLCAFFLIKPHLLSFQMLQRPL